MCSAGVRDAASVSEIPYLYFVNYGFLKYVQSNIHPTGYRDFIREVFRANAVCCI